MFFHKTARWRGLCSLGICDFNGDDHFAAVMIAVSPYRQIVRLPVDTINKNCVLRLLFSCQMIDHDGWAVRKLRHQFKLAPHAFNITPQRREQHVTALFQT
ncbi:MAG: hypothetical protein RL695_839 [Pseudomonadota bacterium]